MNVGRRTTYHRGAQSFWNKCHRESEREIRGQVKGIPREGLGDKATQRGDGGEGTRTNLRGGEEQSVSVQDGTYWKNRRGQGHRGKVRKEETSSMCRENTDGEWCKKEYVQTNGHSRGAARELMLEHNVNSPFEGG